MKGYGFEILKEENEILIEEIKIRLIKKIENKENENLSSFLKQSLNRSYSVLDKLFSETEGITIEKYEVNLKIEMVKEQLQLGQLNFSEIAYSLNYNTSGHLERQFKDVTGMSMTEFKNLQNGDVKYIAQIVEGLSQIIPIRR